MIQLFNNYGFKWQNKSNCWFKGYVFDGDILKTDDEIFSDLELIENKEQMSNWLTNSNGCFSVIIENMDIVILAVDKIRTFPIFYSIENKSIVVTDDPVTVYRKSKQIFKQAEIELETAGYVTGKNTLINEVFQVQAGELITYHKKQIESTFYANFFVQKIDHSPFKLLQEKLSDSLETAFKRLINSLGGRQAVVPLSGGYDSRLIAAMLKKYGYQNVYTFTYGRAGNKELENSQKTAKALGFPWIFIEYNENLINGFIHDIRFFDYCNFAGKASSMFYMQDYFAVKYLHENKLIDSDAVFIPGHSGDSIAGSHLQASISEKVDKKTLIDIIYKKTYSQNIQKKYRKPLHHIIENYIQNLPAHMLAYNILESWVFSERQAKFIVNSANVFDFYGHEYRLPFWDCDLVSFFKTIPFNYKLFKTIYIKTLKETYFKTYSIDFNKELQVNKLDIRKQLIKNKLKEFLPIKVKRQLLEKNDWIEYRFVTNVLSQDLESKEIKFVFKADAYTSIISKWYVEYLKENVLISEKEAMADPLPYS